MSLSRFAQLALAGFVTVAVLPAQTGYGRTGRVWWDAGQGTVFPWEDDYEDPSGQLSVLNTKGAVQTSGHAFFEPLGSNGRACITCHQPSNAMSVSVDAIRKRWTETEGKDPIFAAVDGSNCPELPQEARSSHSLLLDRGLFRIALQWPPKDIKPDFKIDVMKDPTGCNTSKVYGLQSSRPAVSVFRRPRVTANLKYVIAGPDGLTFMADGREPSLESQAISAAMVHEQAQRPTDEQLRQIVEFEKQLFAAQSADVRGGLLSETKSPTELGPDNLRNGRAAALPVAFEAWRANPTRGAQSEFRLSAARGSEVFRNRVFAGSHAAKTTCASCHGAGMTRWMDIGTANVKPAAASPDLPLFRITCDNGSTVYSQDPGRALISGKCADVGAIVMQQFRGLSARAPYFSNGSAQTIADVVDFYDKRYAIGFTAKERQDLINFLSVL